MLKKIFFGLGMFICLSQQVAAECLVKKDDFRAQTCVGRVHLAAFHGHSRCLKGLLRKNPSLVDQPDEYQNTPAHYCVKDLVLDEKKQKCLRILLKNRARLDIRNSYRVTALDLASSFGALEKFEAIRDGIGGKLRSNSCDF